jgi:hypothetical protein
MEYWNNETTIIPLFHYSIIPLFHHLVSYFASNSKIAIRNVIDRPPLQSIFLDFSIQCPLSDSQHSGGFFSVTVGEF